VRLDQLLVERGYFESRARARDAIIRATVRVEGRGVTKPGQMVRDDAALEVHDPARQYVSRAALKLIQGLDRFGLDPAGRIALDLGASTGGFTQVLLERGARHVFAVDVGHGQMSPLFREDKRVTLIENLNARELTGAHLSEIAPGFIACDVSFISLKLALPPALALAAPDARGVFLVKPQFEAGRERIGKNGIVAPAVADDVAGDLRRWLDAVPGWRTLGMVESPIVGGDGNREFLLAGERA
jgi:23S rRNA (cytidine1920-2'-O)/16S rRNA (cytidine1409-2'-O)-methyltransferase